MKIWQNVKNAEYDLVNIPIFMHFFENCCIFQSRMLYF